MNVQVGDILEMKKKPPLRGQSLRRTAGGDGFPLKCEAAAEMLVPRLKIERHIKRIHRQDDTL